MWVEVFLKENLFACDKKKSMSHLTALPPSTALRLKFCADYSRFHIALLAVVSKWQPYHKSYRWETNDVQFWLKLSRGMVLVQSCAVF